MKIIQADAVKLPLDDCSVDLVFGSPPYCDARTYDIDAQRGCAEWVEWMLEVTTEALRVCAGAVVWVVGGVTRKRNYWPACEGLMWEWWKRGGHAYRPCIWYKAGIPGSGGDQWFRADTEYVLCFKRPGKLPWTDNTAMGHPPKWAPGGEMSHRLAKGERRNQWGGTSGSNAGARRANGTRDKKWRPSHRHPTKGLANGGVETQSYQAPVLANPGNLVKVNVGGGHLGSPLAHENEAPFPEDLAQWFVLSLCPPGGTVLDPFSGSGTTMAVARRHGCKAIASDLRFSQCDLTRRRQMGNQHVLEFTPDAGEVK